MKIPEYISIEIRRENEIARNKYGHFNSTHEALAVLEEEVQEFKNHVQSKTNKFNEDEKKYQMQKELMQVAAIAIRAAVELKENKIKHV